MLTLPAWSVQRSVSICASGFLCFAVIASVYLSGNWIREDPTERQSHTGMITRQMQAVAALKRGILTMPHMSKVSKAGLGTLAMFGQ